MLIIDAISNLQTLTTCRISDQLRGALEMLDRNGETLAPEYIELLTTVGDIAFQDAYAVHTAIEQVDADEAASLIEELHGLTDVQEACRLLISIIREDLPMDSMNRVQERICCALTHFSVRLVLPIKAGLDLFNALTTGR